MSLNNIVVAALTMFAKMSVYVGKRQAIDGRLKDHYHPGKTRQLVAIYEIISPRTLTRASHISTSTFPSFIRVSDFHQISNNLSASHNLPGHECSTRIPVSSSILNALSERQSLFSYILK
jgi:hypothetical protein